MTRSTAEVEAGGTAGAGALTWHGGFGRLWGAAAVSRFGDALRGTALSLLALSFALTTLQTLFDNAATALLPVVVPQEALDLANARLMTGQELTGRFVGGPPAPVLIALGAALPFLADAATYLLAAALVASPHAAPPSARPVTAGRTLRREIADGLRQLWRDRVLRAFCLSVAPADVGIGALVATLVMVVENRPAAGLPALGTVVLLPVLQAPDSASSDGGQIPSTTLGFARVGGAPTVR
ncbi:hypothetical protein [Streptomyces caniferus]|uniref:hypothetical protein n=1 Tax=Streptomyces caniferus TaxID=285557 RepID=UPI0039A0C9CF